MINKKFNEFFETIKDKLVIRKTSFTKILCDVSIFLIHVIFNMIYFYDEKRRFA